MTSRFAHLSPGFSLRLGFVVALSVMPIHILAQPITADLTGRVVDELNKPVVGATVSLARLPLSGVTGTDGLFHLQGIASAIHSKLVTRNLNVTNRQGYPVFKNFRWSPSGRRLSPLHTTDNLNFQSPADHSVTLALMKMAALDDTLIVIKAGYDKLKLPLLTYVSNLGDLTLKLPAIQAGCGDTKLPTGALVWVRADDGVEVSGTTVNGWANRGSAGGVFQPNGAPPKLDAALINGKPAVTFDGKTFLKGTAHINGLPELTIGMVTATTEDYLAREDWCQKDFSVPRNEHGCSGTFFNPIMWIETGNWGYTYVGPAKNHISFRFGPGASTYQLTKTQPDPGTGWTRPKSIGEAFTYTMGMKTLSTITMLVEGKEAFKIPIPGKAGPITNVSDNVELGSGRTDARDPTLIRWAGHMAELFVFPRALSADDVERVNAYVRCRYFP